MSRINAEAPNRATARRTGTNPSPSPLHAQDDRTDDSSASLTVRVPATPHVLLSPNRTISQKDRAKLGYPLLKQSTYRIKFALRRELQEATMLAALNGRPDAPLAGPVVLRFTIAYERGRQRLDWDNCCATLKGAIDGIVDAGYLRDDDQVSGIFIEQTKDPAKVGYMVLTVEPVEGARP